MTTASLKDITQKARVPARTEDPKRDNHNGKKPNADEAKQAWEIAMSGLPADIRANMERAKQRIITDAVNADPNNAALDHLLPEIKTIDATTILTTEYPPIDWIVDSYLAPGLTFLVGKPKVGKSWLALQLALSVRTGGKMFERDVKSGHVLILALEDNERRLSDRMKKQGWSPKAGSVDFMMADEFREKITALNSGGGKRLLRFVEKNKYKLVIIDTFTRAIKGDQLDPAEMTAALGPLQQYSLSQNVALVFVDHMPKNSPSQNPIDHVYGSVAKVGVTDLLWGLYKEQGKAGAKLAINGRDVAETELKLMFDTRGFYWHCEGVAQDVEMTSQRTAILDALRELGTATAKEIADATGQRLNHLYGKLNDLTNTGLVRRIASAQTKTVFFELVNESSDSSKSGTSKGC